ncbi:xylulokinase [Agromyces sp. NPDC058136]|uniref:xylulokinase n=1 Tax=Agromyces sp. NPDC058136 TaxID=3346354 RepID=UPI0036D86B78
MTLVAGVDSSTQSCKVVIVDASTGAVVRSGRAAHPAGSEVNPAEWWSALSTAIADAGGLDDAAALSVAGQQHGMVALDEHGEVIRDALLWNDTRSGGAADDLRREIGASEHARRTGLVPVASFTSTKLRWLRDNEPEHARRVAAVALPHDWLTWRLRGYGPSTDDALGADLHALTTDRSDASGTAYWSPTSESYDRELLVRALGRDAVLPRVLGPSESPGESAATAATQAGLVLGPGAGDNAAAALGLGGRAGDAIVSIGTSGTVFAVAEQPVLDPTGTVAGFADAAGGFLPLVATLNAAQVVDTVAALLGLDHEAFGRLALQAPSGSDGVVLLPYFSGERTPDLPHARAQWSGLSLGNANRENFARSAIEGMLAGLASGLDAITAAGAAADRVLLIGGGARLAATRQVAAEVFGLPIVVPDPAEYVALGAAAQAAWTLTGNRPDWAPPGAATIRAQHSTRVRETYRLYAERFAAATRR